MKIHFWGSKFRTAQRRQKYCAFAATHFKSQQNFIIFQFSLLILYLAKILVFISQLQQQ